MFILWCVYTFLLCFRYPRQFQPSRTSLRNVGSSVVVDYLPCATSSAQEEKSENTMVKAMALKKKPVFLSKELRGESDDWRNYLRMDYSAFSQLIELVTPYIKKQDTCMRKAISPHGRFAASLRFLATGRSYKDLEFTIIVSKPTLNKIIPENCETHYRSLKEDCMNSIGDVFAHKFFSSVGGIFLFQQNPHETLALDAAELQNGWTSQQSLKTSGFPHCLGAIDSKHVQIVPPKDRGSYLYNYKKIHSISYKLINDDLRIPGRTNISHSDQLLEYVFIGDEAFAMRQADVEKSLS
ncbi:hypothetical protein PR048_028684 [Dryococelus australis]|uniref:DDE Tnp4 domain-containing protein n=1 Tax=Dryococelus australis TaxID=614101 RepID=A0ABQ9GB92_9NEOP|nr:hypothetical protein PR048_028684 [Dryococelus australis]